ncbi:MAG: FKBP-type peptidyl-prolyl cis-trans isomerase [Deltaproteobacteria bacterium]|nr:FKBP-type peptidyl-prolyl cis-trans isomerase [Deltaproteobacteria bacterium]
MAAVKEGDKVQVHYRGSLDDGSEFESSYESDPLEFEVGSPDIIPGFNQALVGMEPGDKKTVKVPMSKAYGPYRDHFVFEVERQAFPPETNPVVGQVFEMRNEEDRAVHVTVKEVREDKVVIDANHRLAGNDLTFEIELKGIL